VWSVAALGRCSYGIAEITMCCREPDEFVPPRLERLNVVLESFADPEVFAASCDPLGVKFPVPLVLHLEVTMFERDHVLQFGA
jgi:hypothetical protein